MSTKVHPHMELILDELEGVLRKHECGGTLVIATKTHAAWRICFPAWSGIYPEGESRMRIRISSKDSEHGESSLHCLLSMRDMLGFVARMFRTMSDSVLEALKENGADVKHRIQTPGRSS